MTVPASVNANDVVAAADVNQYKNVLEGASGYTDTFVMVSTSGTNFVIRLGDAAGANKVSFQNSSSTEKASIDSNGLLSVSSFSAASGSLVLPQSATPSQTAEGSIAWDTDDDVLTVGTGAATKRLGLTRGAGSSATALNEIVYDTTAAALKVWDGSVSQSVGPTSFFGALQTTFRLPRRLLGWFTAAYWTGTDGTPTVIPQNVGVGFVHVFSTGTAAISNLTNLLLEAYSAMSTGATGNQFIGSFNASQLLVACTAPNKNPRISIRWFPGASNANLTTTIAGFFVGGATPSATSAGAYLRANTTGNLFFVTRQGSSETTTDLGARPTALTSYEIETVDAGVTWTCRNTTTATVVATSTTNVPTATIALGFAAGGVSGLNSLGTANIQYCEVESNSVA